MVMLSFDSTFSLNGMSSYQEFRDTYVGQFIYRDLQKVVNNQKVWKAFLKWSTISPAWAVAAVCGGNAPYIVVEPKHGGGVFGCFKPWEPYNIRLNRTDVMNINSEANESKRQVLLNVLEMTILHELVHWGRHWSGTPSLTYTKWRGYWEPVAANQVESDTDDGDMFEIEVLS